MFLAYDHPLEKWHATILTLILYGRFQWVIKAVKQQERENKERK